MPVESFERHGLVFVNQTTDLPPEPGVDELAGLIADEFHARGDHAADLLGDHLSKGSM